MVRGQQRLTFDELPFQPVDGLNFQGVTFGFTVDGVDSTDANYNSDGPPDLTYVSAIVLEGDASGILTLDFDVPTSVVSFGVALDTLLDLTPGFIVELFDPTLSSLGVTEVTTTPLIEFSEGLFSYSGPLVSRVVMFFNDSEADRFALDNLTYNSVAGNPVPEPGTLLLFGTGLASLVGWRMRKGQA